MSERHLPGASRRLNRLRPVLLALLLLAFAGARILQLTDVTPHFDEMWTLYQIKGSWQETIRWTPYDWPPLYHLSLYGWSKLVGEQPLALRALSLLYSLIGAAVFFRVLKMRAGESAAWLGALLYGGLAYAIYISLELRGYALMHALLLLVWWAGERMLQQPDARRALLLAILAGLAYGSSYISVLPLALISLYLLARMMQLNGAMAGGARRYWALPALAALLLAAHLLLYLWPLMESRSEWVQTLARPPIQQAIPDWLSQMAGRGAALIAALTALAVGRLLWRRRITRLQAFMLLWGVISLLAMFALDHWLGFLHPKYSNWILIGQAGVIAVSLAGLARWPGRIILAAAALFLLALPVDLPDHFSWYLPTHQQHLNFAWLSEEMRAGDRVLMAADHECMVEADYWNHPLLLHLPQGIERVDSPAGQRRVWFVTADGSPNSPHWESLRRDYVERHFVGLPGCLFRLYEGPPDREGVPFANGLRFHGAEMLVDGRTPPPGWIPQAHEGERLRVRLWWTADERLARDYSVGAFLMDYRGRVILESHGPPAPAHPAGAPPQTSQWSPGQLYYEEREFQIPYPFRRQSLDLKLAIYYWEQPAQRFPAPGADELGLLPVLKITISAW